MNDLITSGQYCDLCGANPNQRVVLAKQYPAAQMTVTEWNKAGQPLGLHAAVPDLTESAPADDHPTSDPPEGPRPRRESGTAKP
jgi:hypothetical protein